MAVKRTVNHTKIQKTVEKTVRGPVSYLQSSAVVETFNDKTIWKGLVEVFKVHKPPPVLAYGWAVGGDRGPEYVAVLGNPPINSPVAAVKSWIASQTKKS